jgi:hypothetical protein
MKLKLTIIFALLIISQLLFSQNQKMTLVQNTEGVAVSYYIYEKSDCFFYIDNSSNNAVQIEFDVKIFFSNNESKEIHKKIQVNPLSKKKESAIKAKKKPLALTQSSPIIQKVEVHNVKFSGI